jgi:glycosyltransferase involved in cell wall biosynthesis
LKPLVSILIPAYNSQEWIAETIESALSQTWPRKEVIIVDDGSRDETVAVARNFEDRNVRVFTQPNQGASAARNAAYAHCRGDYIQWLDADDLLAPDKIELQMRAAEAVGSKGTLFSSEWGQFMYRFQRAEFSPTSIWGDLNPTEWLMRKMGEDLTMQPSAWLVSRDLSDAAGPWDIRLWKDNDGEYFCRVVLASNSVKFVRGAKSYYRTAGFSSVSYVGRSDKKMESLLLSARLHVDYLLSLEDSERTRAACVDFLQATARTFYPFRLDLFEELDRMAMKLGGRLGPPPLSWKYAWIQKLFGWPAARRAQLKLPRLKRSVLIAFDRAMFRLENRRARKQRALPDSHDSRRSEKAA